MFHHSGGLAEHVLNLEHITFQSTKWLKLFDSQSLVFEDVDDETANILKLQQGYISIYVPSTRVCRRSLG